METLDTPVDEVELFIEYVLSAVATRRNIEHNLPTRAALDVLIDSILDYKLETRSK